MIRKWLKRVWEAATQPPLRDPYDALEDELIEYYIATGDMDPWPGDLCFYAGEPAIVVGFISYYERVIAHCVGGKIVTEPVDVRELEM